MSGSRGSGGVLVVGSSNTDLVCTTDRLPRPGETVASRSFAIYAGGKAANQAVAAARAGAEVAFVGAFGDDSYGSDRRRDLEAEGIDLRYSRTIPDTPSGLALIAVDRAGENLIVTVGGANDRIETGQLREALDDVQPAVILLPNENPPSIVEAALDRGGTATRVFNAAPYHPSLTPLLGNVDILICNEIEASGFLGYEVDAGNAREAVSGLVKLGCRRAVITLGDAGATGFDGERAIHVPALDVEPVDATGAGDAFCGAFAAWYAAGASFEESLKAGVAAGSLAVEVSGAQPSLPRRERIAARI